MDKVIELAQLFDIPNGYTILTGISILAFLVVYRKQYHELKNAIIYPAIGVIICVATPVLPTILDKLIRNPARYVRIYWLIPIVLILGIAAIFVGELAAGEKQKWGIYGLAGLLLVFAGNFLLTSENFVKADNIYKIPREAIDICEMLPEDTREIRIAVPPSLSSYIRQYDGNVKMLHGRTPHWSKREVFDLMNQAELDIPYITMYSRQYSCDYIVLETTKFWNDTMENWGFQEVSRTGDYVLYQEDWNDKEGMLEASFLEYGGVTDGDIYVLQSGDRLMVYNHSDEYNWVLVQQYYLQEEGIVVYDEERAAFVVENEAGEVISRLFNRGGLLSLE